MTPRRARATIVVAVGAVVVGAVVRAAGGGPDVVPCPNPGLNDDGVLVCDGGGPLGDRAWLFGQKLDLNSASAESLARIRGVGPSVANAIVAHREAHGPFASVDELDDVKGVGPKLMATVAAAAEVRAPPGVPLP